MWKKEKRVYLLTIKEFEDNQRNRVSYIEKEVFSSKEKCINFICKRHGCSKSLVKSFMFLKYWNCVSFNNFDYEIESLVLH